MISEWGVIPFKEEKRLYTLLKNVRVKPDNLKSNLKFAMGPLGRGIIQNKLNISN